MRRKRIGLRYCGGCNPTYERTEWVKRLKDQLPHRLDFVRHEEGTLDGLLLVYGCLTACPNDVQDAPTVPHFLVVRDEDMDDALGWLGAIAEQGDSP